VRIEDLGISRQHAEIRLTHGRATIVDLGSTNGVVVDGFRAPAFELADGMRLQLGSTTVVFRSGSTREVRRGGR
jgi:pSer/pThr/pTyr-binding forkhead associated (FHA) protein